jgi:hypothetical protein
MCAGIPPEEFIPTDTEKLLIAKVAAGKPADFQVGDAAADDPCGGAVWGDGRSIRAELLERICAGRQPLCTPGVKGLVILGARITGLLDLSGMEINFPLEFNGCRFDSPVRLSGAQTRVIRFSGSRVPGLLARNLSTKGNVYLDKGFVSAGCVELMDAKIGGSFICSGGSFRNPGADAIIGSRLAVEGAFFLFEGFRAEGEIKLIDAKVGGALAFKKAELHNPGGFALNAERLEVKGTLAFKEGVECSGQIKLVGAQVGGVFELKGTQLRNPGGVALQANGVVVKGAIIIREGFRAEGEVSFGYASVGATFECSRATFINPGRGLECLSAHELTTASSIRLGPAFRAEGSVVFTGAKIGGDLSCRGVECSFTKGEAFVASRAIIKHNLVMDGFTAKGKTRLAGAEVGGSVECHLVKCIYPPRPALAAERLDVKGSVLFNDRFESFGGVRLDQARIGGDFDCTGAAFGGETEPFAAPGVEVRGTFRWLGIKKPLSGIVNLAGAKVARLDDELSSWPERQLDLLNFTYDSFAQPEQSASKRLVWLRRQKEFSAQPYEQAVQVLRRTGQEEDARRVARGKQAELCRRGRLGWPTWAWKRALGFAIGYGYQLWRAVLLSVLVVAVGAFVFGASLRDGVMIPVKDRPKHYKPGTDCPPNVPCFNSFVYSLDVFLPVIDLRLESYWLPVRKEGEYAVAYQTWYYVQVVLGWVLTTLMVAGLTGLIRKD